MRAASWPGLALLLLVSPAALAATFQVTRTADSADGACDAHCSLREAVSAARATPEADVIRLGARTYVLTVWDALEEDANASGDLDVGGEVLLRGHPGGGTIIDGNATDRVLEILPGAKVTVRDVTLRNGRAPGRGGGVYNAGTLRLVRANVADSVLSSESGPLHGGGIFNAGTLDLHFSRVSGNIAMFGVSGGRGGGIYNAAGSTLTMLDSAIEDNEIGLDDSVGFGGGLYNRGTARISRSFLGNNDPGDGEGGAIANRHGGRLAVLNTTISGNGHDGALAAVANGSAQEPDNAPPRASLWNVTIADNNGGGVYNTGRLRLHNALIAGNYSQDGHDRYYDTNRSCLTEGGNVTVGFSIIADGNCGGTPVDNASAIGTVIDPLTMLGGPTPVHPLRAGPYAIDAGDNARCPYYDQRRGRRPADGDGNGTEVCDIGAMESGADE